jgi:hypothetical protein
MQHLLLPVNIQMSKIIDSQSYRYELDESNSYGYLCFPYELVGLDRIELSTSPLSGVRSSQLSYRPKFGGAGRDRTGDLLNANQALSQLSYSPVA